MSKLLIISYIYLVWLHSCMEFLEQEMDKEENFTEGLAPPSFNDSKDEFR